MRINDNHKKAADTGYRPAKESDEGFDSELHQIITLTGTPWVVSCKRQIVEGDGRVGWIIEWWFYRPNGDLDHIERGSFVDLR